MEIPDVQVMTRVYRTSSSAFFVSAELELAGNATLVNRCLRILVSVDGHQSTSRSLKLVAFACAGLDLSAWTPYLIGKDFQKASSTSLKTRGAFNGIARAISNLSGSTEREAFGTAMQFSSVDWAEERLTFIRAAPGHTSVLRYSEVTVLFRTVKATWDTPLIEISRLVCTYLGAIKNGLAAG